MKRGPSITNVRILNDLPCGHDISHRIGTYEMRVIKGMGLVEVTGFKCNKCGITYDGCSCGSSLSVCPTHPRGEE